MENFNIKSWNAYSKKGNTYPCISFHMNDNSRNTPRYPESLNSPFINGGTSNFNSDGKYIYIKGTNTPYDDKVYESLFCSNPLNMIPDNKDTYAIINTDWQGYPLSNGSMSFLI